MMTTHYTFYLIVILFVSCSKDTARNVIYYKSQHNSFDNPLPKGLCRFAIGTGREQITFQDSCHFYNMLDTIK